MALENSSNVFPLGHQVGHKPDRFRSEIALDVSPIAMLKGRSGDLFCAGCNTPNSTLNQAVHAVADLLVAAAVNQ